MRPYDDRLERAVGRVEGKLDQLLDALSRHYDDDKHAFSSLDNRVSTLVAEHQDTVRKLVWFSGAGSALAATLGSLAGFFLHRL
jgi:hypothetical protein